MGEYPYAALICRGEEVVCETINPVTRDRDVTRHAEVVAISEAQRLLATTSLDDCTIYVNAESCASCCYAIRESRIGRVVLGTPAPLTGGLSRWNILQDTKLSENIPEVFASPPQVILGFLQDEAEEALRRWNPLAWHFIRSRNVFGGPLPQHLLAPASQRHSQKLGARLMSFLRRKVFDYFGRR